MLDLLTIQCFPLFPFFDGGASVAALPYAIEIEPQISGVQVKIAPFGGVTLPAGVPVYPLASDPSQTWDLQDVNGVLTWVQFSVPPGVTAFALEDGLGVIALEDNAGLLVLER